MTVLGLRRCEMAFVTCPCFLRLQHRVLKKQKTASSCKIFRRILQQSLQNLCGAGSVGLPLYSVLLVHYTQIPGMTTLIKQLGAALMTRVAPMVFYCISIINPRLRVYETFSKNSFFMRLLLCVMRSQPSPRSF